MSRNLKIKIFSYGLVALFVFSNLATGLFQLCLKPDGSRQFEFIFEECSDAVEEEKTTCSSCDCHHSHDDSESSENEISQNAKCHCDHIQIDSEDLYTIPMENEIISSLDVEYVEPELEFNCYSAIKPSTGPSPPKIIDLNLTCLGTVIQRT